MIIFGIYVFTKTKSEFWTEIACSVWIVFSSSAFCVSFWLSIPTASCLLFSGSVKESICCIVWLSLLLLLLLWVSLFWLVSILVLWIVSCIYSVFNSVDNKLSYSVFL